MSHEGYKLTRGERLEYGLDANSYQPRDSGSMSLVLLVGAINLASRVGNGLEAFSRTVEKSAQTQYALGKIASWQRHDLGGPRLFGELSIESQADKSRRYRRDKVAFDPVPTPDKAAWSVDRKRHSVTQPTVDLGTSASTFRTFPPPEDGGNYDVHGVI